jgi:hypothetical protein
MAQNPFVGIWRYRSFQNIPGPIENFNEIKFGQALLTLWEEAPDQLSGYLEFGKEFNDNYLDMSGTVQDSDRPTVRLRGTGVKDTDTDGWIYDYIGYLAPSWRFPALEGDSQRRTIVGTLIRTVRHGPGIRPAGYSGSFVAVYVGVPGHTIDPEDLVPYELPETVIAHFADRLHRLHHVVWHALRNSWENDTKWGIAPDKRARIEALGWKPPRPAQEFREGPEGPNSVLYGPHITNGSGEDFLYMHREMLVQYRALMAEAEQPIISWVAIPPPPGMRPVAPRSANAVPPAWPVPGQPVLEQRIAALKSAEFYWSRMRWWDQEFKDPTYLATLTLGELGALLEFTVHNDMHTRWAALPRDPDTDQPLPSARPDRVRLPDNSEGPNIGTKWDNPRYNNLLDFYSSHVNPIFWRLHGWIDDRIDDWYEAHERVHPGEVVRRRCGAVEWFEPGRWVQVADPWVWPAQFSDGGHGGADHPHHGGGHDGNSHHVDPEERQRRIESIEQVLAIVYFSPASSPVLHEGPAGLAEPEVPFEALTLKMPI